MDKFQKYYEEMQNSILEIFNDITVILHSTTKTSDTKVKLLKQYVKEQYEIICADIAIHNDDDIENCKIKELAVPEKHN